MDGVTIEEEENGCGSGSDDAVSVRSILKWKVLPSCDVLCDGLKMKLISCMK